MSYEVERPIQLLGRSCEDAPSELLKDDLSHHSLAASPTYSIASSSLSSNYRSEDSPTKMWCHDFRNDNMSMMITVSASGVGPHDYFSPSPPRPGMPYHHNNKQLLSPVPDCLDVGGAPSHAPLSTITTPDVAAPPGSTAAAATATAAGARIVSLPTPPGSISTSPYWRDIQTNRSPTPSYWHQCCQQQQQQHTYMAAAAAAAAATTTTDGGVSYHHEPYWMVHPDSFYTSRGNGAGHHHLHHVPSSALPARTTPPLPDRHTRRKYPPEKFATTPSIGPETSKVVTATPRRYKCTVCVKRFTRPSSLATHMHSHTGEKPYKCMMDGCGRRFSVVSNLRRHAKIHSNSNSLKNLL